MNHDDTNRNEKDYYKRLDVAPHASRAQIREAYIRLRNTFSGPQHALYSLMSEEEAQEILREIDEAFQVLNDDYKRAEYDKSIGIVADAPDILAFGHKKQHSTSSEGNRQVPEDAITAISSKSCEHSAFDAGSSPAVVKQRSSFAPIVAPASKNLELQEKAEQLIEESDLGDGALYKSLRELMQVSEDELQARTKVCVAYIRAIEANDYAQLPAAVFVKGFLESYLKYLAVPRQADMVKAFMERFKNRQG